MRTVADGSQQIPKGQRFPIPGMKAWEMWLILYNFTRVSNKELNVQFPKFQQSSEKIINFQYFVLSLVSWTIVTIKFAVMKYKGEID